MIELILALPLIYIIIILGLCVFWLWTLVDILLAKNPILWKIEWLIVIGFFGQLGSLLYYLIVIRKMGNGKRR